MTAAPRRSVLVLGGTAWLSGEVARAALAAGHTVTCLARGESGTVPDGAELVRGDRASAAAYDAVADRSWDLVVDVSRQPLHVRSAVDALAGRTRHWVFVSTVSVYADDSVSGQDESAPVHEPWAGTGLAAAEDYGPAKVACERVLLEARPDALVARAGLIVGYGDPSDRFGYWPARFARAVADEPVLVPPPDDPCQVIDVEDLAGWLLRSGLTRTGGVVNAVGPVRTLGEIVQTCREVTGSRARPVAADGVWLSGQGVEPWMGPESLPLWLPLPEYAGHPARDRSRAEAAGLTTRPLQDTVRGALAWEQELGLERPRRAGLSSRRERELLALLG
ncbi:MAG: NAD-dependent epimerase/dehydratase family protein [Actinomycetes bacterium]